MKQLLAAAIIALAAPAGAMPLEIDHPSMLKLCTYEPDSVGDQHLLFCPTHFAHEIAPVAERMTLVVDGPSPTRVCGVVILWRASPNQFRTDATRIADLYATSIEEAEIFSDEPHAGFASWELPGFSVTATGSKKEQGVASFSAYLTDEPPCPRK